MLKTEVLRGPRARVLLMDTITKVAAEDAGSIVIAASHGGASSGEFALAVPLLAVFFNDAGVGKQRSGIAALAMLQARNVAAGAVSHESACIGDAADMWEHGVISHLNAAALALGFREGALLRGAVASLVG